MFKDRRASVSRGVWCTDPATLRLAMDNEVEDPKGSWALEPGDRARGFAVTAAGTAIIPIIGVMTKGESMFTMFGAGTSSLATRQAVRAAVADESVSSILLFVDSPGGEVAGIDELAEEVRAANREKPVFAFVEDEGASAAVWVASQAQQVFSNKMAAVGSIGVFAVVTDASQAMEEAGVKVHVISTGDFKGGAFGAEVSEGKLAEVQRMVDAINVEFKGAVKKGRSMTAKAVDAIADGRMFTAPEAQSLGLTDGVSTIEKVLGAMDKEVRARGRARRARATAAQLNIDKRK